MIAWYGKESGLTPLLTILPTGNVTIASPEGRKLTLGEVTDLIKESLMAQKLILIRRTVSFYIHPTDERIAPSLIRRIDGRPDIVFVPQPELRKYAVAPGTPDVVPKALLAVNPRLRCIAVQAANEIWVMATPEEHTALAAWFKLVSSKTESGRER